MNPSQRQHASDITDPPLPETQMARACSTAWSSLEPPAMPFPAPETSYFGGETVTAHIFEVAVLVRTGGTRCALPEPKRLSESHPRCLKR